MNSNLHFLYIWNWLYFKCTLSRAYSLCLKQFTSSAQLFTPTQSSIGAILPLILLSPVPSILQVNCTVLFLLDSCFHKNQSSALIWKSPVIWKHQQMMLMIQWCCEVNWLSGNGIPIPVTWYQYLYPLYSLVIELEFFHDSVRVTMGIWLSGCLVFVCWFSFIVFLVILLLFPCIYMYSHIGGLVFLGFQGQGGAQKYYHNPVCSQITIDLPQSPYI